MVAHSGFLTVARKVEPGLAQVKSADVEKEVDEPGRPEEDV